MTTYVIRRLLAIVPVLLGVSLVVFLGMKMVPGDVAEIMLGEKGSPEELARLREQLGLNAPLYVQYWRFLRRAVTGNFGRSLRTRESALTEVALAFPTTIELSVVALLVAVSIGIPAGVLAAVRPYSLFDNLTMVLVLIGVSMPVFWTALLLMLLGSLRLGWFPISGILSDGITLQRITGIHLLDALLTRNWVAGKDILAHLVLPAIALGTIPIAIIARMTRATMLEVLRQEYITTARAKGLGSWAVIGRHAFKNALIPVVTVVGLQFGNLLSGAVLTETVFAFPGIGRLAVTSILYRDFPVVQALVLLSATLFVLINLLVDLTYAYLDPRIRLTGAS
ncbi:MAG: ABC transporter permease [Nitrospinota bacterium]|nr:MAG: ABC transporter permease [Nitrospinota bacterium]